MTDTEYESQITEINSSHEEYAINVQNYKKQIADAITEMGIVTSEEADATTMVNNIKSIEGKYNKDFVGYLEVYNSTTSYGATGSMSNYINTDIAEYTNTNTITFKKACEVTVLLVVQGGRTSSSESFVGNSKIYKNETDIGITATTGSYVIGAHQTATVSFNIGDTLSIKTKTGVAGYNVGGFFVAYINS